MENCSVYVSYPLTLINKCSFIRTYMSFFGFCLYMKKCKIMSEKIAKKLGYPNTCIKSCPTLSGLIEPIHHSDWMNLPLSGDQSLYRKIR